MAILMAIIMLTSLHSMPLYCASFNNSPEKPKSEYKDSATMEKADRLITDAKQSFLINPELSLDISSKALQYYRQAGDKPGMAKSLNIVGACHFSLGRYKMAIDNFKEASILNTQLNEQLNLAKNLNNIGNVYLKTTDYETALENYFKASKLFEELNQDSYLISIYNNIGLIYKNTGELTNAMDIYNKALKSSRKVNDRMKEGSILYNISNIYLEQYKYRKGIEYCEKSLAIRKEQNDINGEVKNLTALGRMYFFIGQPEKSIQTLQEALSIAREINNVNEEALILQHLGYNTLESGNVEESRNYILQSQLIAEKYNFSNIASNNFKYLTEIDSLNGHFESAMANQQKYFLLKNNNTEFSVDRKLEELQKKYEFTRQQQIETDKQLAQNRTLTSYLLCLTIMIVLIGLILLQRQKIKTQKEINELSQQNLRSQINPHFIFNVLNSIQYYILRNDSEASCKYLQKFARLLRLTLDNSQDKLVPINDELESLKLYLELESMRLENNLEYEIELDQNIDSYMFKIPTLLLQPFVENSIIHGLQKKKGKGKVLVRMSLKNNAIHCTIEDNGVGRDSAAYTKTDEQKQRKSYGRKITETRLSLLNSLYGKNLGVEYSDLTDDQKKPCGTRVEFDLPILN